MGPCSGARVLPQYRVGWRTALRRKIFGVARIVGPGHIDFDTLTEVVLATVSEQPGHELSPRVEAA